MISKINHTQIANEIIDDYMSKLSGSQLKVLLVICRKTIGWHKDVDSISINQIVQISGLSNKTVIESIQALEIEHNLIKVDRKKVKYNFNYTNKYTLNYSSSVNATTGGSVKTTPRGSVKITQGSVKTTPRGSVKITQTKETITKETITKEKKNADKSAFNDIKTIFTSKSKEIGNEYYHDGKQAKAIKELEKRYLVDKEKFIGLVGKFKRIIENAKEPFWHNMALDPHNFKTHLNNIFSYDLNYMNKSASEQTEDIQTIHKKWEKKNLEV